MTSAAPDSARSLPRIVPSPMIMARPPSGLATPASKLPTISFSGIPLPRPPKNELAIGVPAEPDSLNPILFTTQSAANVSRLIFNGLIRFDENLEPAPDLAESWEQRQTSTISFRSRDEALRAARLLGEMPE